MVLCSAAREKRTTKPNKTDPAIFLGLPLQILDNQEDIMGEEFHKLCVLSLPQKNNHNETGPPRLTTGPH